MAGGERGGRAEDEDVREGPAERAGDPDHGRRDGARARDGGPVHGTRGEGVPRRTASAAAPRDRGADPGPGGGGRGRGRAWAVRSTDLGARAFLVARRGPPLRETAELIRSKGGTAGFAT